MGFWTAYKSTSQHGVTGYLAVKSARKERMKEAEKSRLAEAEHDTLAFERRVQLKEMPFKHEVSEKREEGKKANKAKRKPMTIPIRTGPRTTRYSVGRVPGSKRLY